ncbi:DoxX family protein [Flectobacillus longus]|uniref:DoxX family protein n=1 Tax=Flectobacillus longus TaxID=2984207 RepID=UPI0024B6A492|nr:DoxX family protein [Flectobacillus longus]MDI9879340.1 DoxX family protein [Flectobacillus longus]
MQKLFDLLFRPILMPRWWQDVFISIPRIICGYWLSSDFGASKFGLPWSPSEINLGLFEVVFWFPSDVSAYGGIFKTFSVFLAYMGAFSEGIGGIAFILGFQTRLFSFLMACTMLVAALCQQWDNGLWSMMPALGILWVSMFHLIIGSGRFSVDYLIFQKQNFRIGILSFLPIVLVLLMSGVQSTKIQTVTVQVTLPHKTPVSTIGVRGNDSPLNWDSDFAMKEVIKDSIYTAQFKINTGFKFTRIKFALNGDIELKDQDKRYILFDEKTTNTSYKAVYNLTQENKNDTN